MTQNIYDDPHFFEGYSGLPRSVDGLEAAPEWPSLRALLPDLAGAHVLDLGCGFGWFCRFAREKGAAQVLGLDVSENMLARAREMTRDEAITYRRGDLEKLEVRSKDGAPFGLVYSSLTLHYVVDLAGLLATVHRLLVPGGRFVASVEHPLLTAPSAPGWVTSAEGRKTWPVDCYLEEGPRSTDWLVKASSSSTAASAPISTSCCAQTSASPMSRIGGRPTARSRRGRASPSSASARLSCCSPQAGKRGEGCAYPLALAEGSPSDSISRFAQLKKAAPWITSAMARSSRPTSRSRWICSAPKLIGVVVSAVEAAMMAFQRGSRSARMPLSSRALGVMRGEARMHRGAEDAAIQARGRGRRKLALGAR